MHIYTTKVSKGPKQVLNLSTMHSKLGESPKHIYIFLQYLPAFFYFEEI